ncbi:MAG: winged helix-turn-helix domain-containing protein [Acidimicrobiales bacterium]
MCPQDRSDESPLRELSDVVHQRSRLAILSALYEVGEADFAFVRRVTGLTEGNLSRHLQILESAGVVGIDKGYVGRRPRTWVRISDAGVKALEDEITILRKLVANVDTVDPSARKPPASKDKPIPVSTNPQSHPAWP